MWQRQRTEPKNVSNAWRADSPDASGLMTTRHAPVGKRDTQRVA